MIPEQFETNRLLQEFTTIGIGGPAEFFIEVKEIALMQSVILFCQENQLPYFILGKGSNVLFDDRGFKGVVIVNKIDFLEIPAKNIWHVGAGYSFSLLGSKTARQGLTGLEFASGIPGSVGGAVYMNAGANGGETSDSLISVDYITPEGECVCIPKTELEFSYRYSSFQERKGVITGATFQLADESSARDKQLKIIQYRINTQPYHEKSAGCVFRNPPGEHAGALIERAGLKNKQVGGAQVSTMHANFVINQGTAKSKDVLQLIDLIRLEVKGQTGIELESEIRQIPFEGD